MKRILKVLTLIIIIALMVLPFTACSNNKNAKKIMTDSGGLQREAFYAGKKCVTILDFVCWPETMIDNRNELSQPIAEEIIEKLHHEQVIDEKYQPFGDGHSAIRIVEAMEKQYKERKKL